MVLSLVATVRIHIYGAFCLARFHLSPLFASLSLFVRILKVTEPSHNQEASEKPNYRGNTLTFGAGMHVYSEHILRKQSGVKSKIFFYSVTVAKHSSNQRTNDFY